MKTYGVSIRFLLYVLIIAIIVVPLVVFYVGVDIVVNELKESKEIKEIDHYAGYTVEVKNIVQKNLRLLNNHDSLSTELKPYLVNDKTRVIIFDSNKFVIYDSFNIMENAYLLDENSFGIDTITISFTLIKQTKKIGLTGLPKQNIHNNMAWYRYNFTIKNIEGKILNGLYLVNHEDLKGINTTYANSFKQIMNCIFISIILVLVLLSIVVKRKLLTPLKQLNKSAEAISQNDFTQDITYNQNDEMGRFCFAFNNMKQQLQISRINLVEDSESRKILIGNIAHDLRTPITSIKGYVEGLIDGIPKKQEELDRYYKVINHKAEQLDYLINDLFTFSQLELGQLKINPKPVPKLLLLQPYINNHHNINLNINEGCLMENELLYIDKKQIDRVFRNIIDNSAKFGANNINVCCKLIDEFLQITITDDGVGINSKIIDKVFERFFTYVPNNAEKAGGSGMGLAICQEIIKLHSGAIEAKSNNNGTSIIFTLPLYKEIVEGD